MGDNGENEENQLFMIIEISSRATVVVSTNQSDQSKDDVIVHHFIDSHL